jgi:threonine/homoserine/homoserine lactone efflux protein
MLNELFPPWPLLMTFMGASLALALTPGPGVIYIVTRTLAQGRRCGLASVAGVACGNVANALLATGGVAALLAVSAWAFELLKWAGAVYLMWLGVQQWRAPTVEPASGSEALINAADPLPTLQRQPDAVLAVWREGVVVALLNPKTTLFFAAFLPQFMTPDSPAAAQSMALGTLFVVIAAITDSAYVLLAGWVAPRLAQAHQAQVWGRRVAGSAFIGLGLLTALSARPGR